jgi:hypothetical protein
MKVQGTFDTVSGWVRGGRAFDFPLVFQLFASSWCFLLGGVFADFRETNQCLPQQVGLFFFGLPPPDNTPSSPGQTYFMFNTSSKRLKQGLFQVH